ncbi:hypothetical protein [Paraburkholderia sp. HP33-1]|uniref:hypothetical protein n=1 Tax=Paraburkholderia sp. HP33-1 TaxID=2883243 RepID=UPI001F16354F|nr:hypothetical protein [Paraburkholderia sp. HP33-1]
MAKQAVESEQGFRGASSASAPATVSAPASQLSASASSISSSANATAPAEIKPASSEGAKPGYEKPHGDAEAERMEGFTLFGLYIKVSDAALVFFTALLALFTFRLWKSTHLLWQEARTAGETAEKSANAALASADAATTTVNAMIAERQPRWLVSDMQITLEPIKTTNPQWNAVARVTLTNIGKSDASVTGAAIAVGFGQLPSTPDYSTARKIESSSFSNVVRPSAAWTIALPIGSSMGLTETQVADVNNGTPMWIYGYLEYFDYLDRTWVKGFVGAVSSSVDWYPWDNGQIGRKGGGKFEPPSHDAGVTAYTYMRIQLSRE